MPRPMPDFKVSLYKRYPTKASDTAIKNAGVNGYPGVR